MNKGKLSRVKLKALNSDSGMTLIEVLLALIITAFISVVIANVTMGASRSLQVTAEEAINAQQSVVFSQRLKADISNSVSLYVFTQNKPSDSNTLQLCDGIGSNFSINSEKGRPLFTINVKDNSDGEIPARKLLKVEYDLISKTDNFGNKETFQLTRRVCGKEPQSLLTIGDTLCKSVSGEFLGLARRYDVGKPHCPFKFVSLNDFVSNANSNGQSIDSNLAGSTFLFCKGDYKSELIGGEGFKSCANDSDVESQLTYGSILAQGPYFFGLPYAGCKVAMAVLTSSKLGAQTRCELNRSNVDSNGVALSSIKSLVNMTSRIDN